MYGPVVGETPQPADRRWSLDRTAWPPVAPASATTSPNERSGVRPVNPADSRWAATRATNSRLAADRVAAFDDEAEENADADFFNRKGVKERTKELYSHLKTDSEATVDQVDQAYEAFESVWVASEALHKVIDESNERPPRTKEGHKQFVADVKHANREMELSWKDQPKESDEAEVVQLMPVSAADEIEMLKNGFPDWISALGMFFSRYAPAFALGKSWLPSSTPQFNGLQYARSLGLDKGTLHWADHKFVNGAVIIKIKDELLQPSYGWAQDAFSAPENYTLKQAITIDFPHREMIVTQKISLIGTQIEDMKNFSRADKSGVLVRFYPLPRRWLTVLKTVQYPEPWEDREIMMYSGQSCLERMYEDTMLMDVERSVEVGSHRF